MMLMAELMLNGFNRQVLILVPIAIVNIFCHRLFLMKDVAGLGGLPIVISAVSPAPPVLAVESISASTSASHGLDLGQLELQMHAARVLWHLSIGVRGGTLSTYFTQSKCFPSLPS